MSCFAERDVEFWIQNLPPSFDKWENGSPAPHAPPPPCTEKRRAEQLTPPATPNEMENLGKTPKRKRARLLESMADSEITPRPSQPTRRLLRSSSTSSDSQTSTQSRSPSPLKRQLMALRLDGTGFKLRQLQIDAPPRLEAAGIFSDMRDIGNGIEILPEAIRTPMTKGLSIEGANTRAWRYAFRPDVLPEVPGRIPTPEEIILVREWAAKCHEALHEEAGWGEEVHHRLLEAIFRNPGTMNSNSENGSHFNFTSCQSARPHQRWLPQSARANMIDKCIYFDASSDINYTSALQELSRHTPTLTVNHTDFTALQLHMIVASIEIKKGGGKSDAKLQMGTWHTAQWAYLRWAVLASLQRIRSDEEMVVLQRLADDNLSRLPFLVGIIIEGHSWAFTISTQESSGTSHWEDHRFGTTENYLDICKAVAGVRRLTAYAQEVYVPWFQKYILSGFGEFSGDAY